jgi:predicted dehydrogenase
MDSNINRAASMSKTYGIPVYSDDARVVVESPTIDLIYIASNHASHADYAIAALERGKNVYIEKPHVVSEKQLGALLSTMDRSPGRVSLGFNRPGSRFGRLILSTLELEDGPGMYTWFVAGHAIEPDHWYFAPKEGGRVLGNLCHWTDFVLRMAPAAQFPVEIRPTRGAKSDADIVVTYTFPDETIAVISFSAKGHTFEGVNEKLNAHRGKCLLSMDNYQTLVIDIGETRRRYSSLFRDHGHEANIIGAFDAVRNNIPVDRAATRRYIGDTGWLFLKTREALEANRPLTVSACPF